MKDINQPHIGPMTGYEVTADGPKYEYTIHRAGELSDGELKEALADNHNIDPESFQIKKPRIFTDSKGRKGTSFAGAWANGACKWQPTGPKANYGHDTTVNIN